LGFRFAVSGLSARLKSVTDVLLAAFALTARPVARRRALRRDGTLIGAIGAIGASGLASGQTDEQILRQALAGSGLDLRMP
jgi:uncharacterized protein GlcG (DUF336 family)